MQSYLYICIKFNPTRKKKRIADTIQRIIVRSIDSLTHQQIYNNRALRMQFLTIRLILQSRKKRFPCLIGLYSFNSITSISIAHERAKDRKRDWNDSIRTRFDYDDNVRFFFFFTVSFDGWIPLFVLSYRAVMFCLYCFNCGEVVNCFFFHL